MQRRGRGKDGIGGEVGGLHPCKTPPGASAPLFIVQKGHTKWLLAVTSLLGENANTHQREGLVRPIVKFILENKNITNKTKQEHMCVVGKWTDKGMRHTCV